MAITVYSFTDTKEQNQDKPCPICSAKEKGLKTAKKDCCKHQTKLVKVDDSIKKQSNFDFSVKFWGDTIPNNLLGAVFDSSIVVLDDTKSSIYYSSKVHVRDNPLYIFHSVYRI